MFIFTVTMSCIKGTNALKIFLPDTERLVLIPFWQDNDIEIILPLSCTLTQVNCKLIFGLVDASDEIFSQRPSGTVFRRTSQCFMHSN